MKKHSRMTKTFGSTGVRFAVVALGAGCVLAGAQVRITAAKSVQAEPRALTTTGAEAQLTSETMQGPVLGYLFEAPTQSLRPILGIAGASHLGDAMPLGLSLSLTAQSPAQDYLLGVDAATGEIQVVDLRSVQPAVRRVDGAEPAVDRIVLSPRGSTAALYHRRSKQVQIVKGLPGDPRVDGGASLTSLPGVLTALAIDDEGEWLLAAVSQEAEGSLYALSSEGESRLLSSVGQVSALTFLEGSDDALLADYQRNELMLLRGVSQGPQTLVLASEQDGLRAPVAVAASADGSRAFAASSQTQQIASVPLQGGVPTFLACGCTPTSLEPLRGGSVFRMTPAGEQPLFLLDVSQVDPRVVFVPPSDGSRSIPAGDVAPRRSRGRVAR